MGVADHCRDSCRCLLSHPQPPTPFAWIGMDSQNFTISALAKAYSERHVAVFTLIFSRPVDPIQSFADAFKLRKDRSDG